MGAEAQDRRRRIKEARFPAVKSLDSFDFPAIPSPSELVVLAQERRQLERLQVMSEQKLGRISHDAGPVSRPKYVLAEVMATWACGR